MPTIKNYSNKCVYAQRAIRTAFRIGGGLDLLLFTTLALFIHLCIRFIHAYVYVRRRFAESDLCPGSRRAMFARFREKEKRATRFSPPRIIALNYSPGAHHNRTSMVAATGDGRRNSLGRRSNDRCDRGCLGIVLRICPLTLPRRETFSGVSRTLEPRAPFESQKRTCALRAYVLRTERMYLIYYVHVYRIYSHYHFCPPET